MAALDYRASIDEDPRNAKALIWCESKRKRILMPYRFLARSVLFVDIERVALLCFCSESCR